MAIDTTGAFKALIVGGGVAALEAALALKDIAGDRIDTTLLAPDTEFVYRPMSVREPFGRTGAAHFPLAPVLAAAGARHTVASLRWLDHRLRVAHDDTGAATSYDAVLLALGAKAWARYPRAITIDPSRIDDQLHGIVQDIEMGLVTSIAFVIPAGRSWPLPAYELALMTAARANAMGEQPKITLITPEVSPLAIFGATASRAVAAALADAGIDVITAAATEVLSHGHITVRGRSTPLRADRVVALPELLGRAVPGLPASALKGFVATDAHGRVRHTDRVFAAGDMTDFPVKQGAIAAQQAAAVAQELAGLAGIPTLATPFEPIIHGVLLGASKPLYLRSQWVGGRPSTSEASETPLWDSADKVHAPYLTRILATLGKPGLSMSTLAPI